MLCGNNFVKMFDCNFFVLFDEEILIDDRSCAVFYNNFRLVLHQSKRK